MTASLLLLDPDPLAAAEVRRHLERQGYTVRRTGDARAARELLRGGAVDLVLVGDDGPAADELRSLADDTAGAAAAAGAVPGAAADAPPVLRWSATNGSLARLDREIAETLDRERGRRRRRDALAGADWVAESAAMRAFLSRLERAMAARPSSVVLRGEHGTGRTLAARTLHRSWTDGPFVVYDAADAARAHAAVDLFGVEPEGEGARRLDGALDRAEGGTLYVRNVERLPRAAQRALSRLPYERVFVRPGATEPQPADVRLIVGSTRDLRAEAEAGRFSRELLHRLGAVELELPPLRDRRADILPLARRMIETLSRRLDRPCRGLTEAAEHRLLEHDWPGNALELRNALERAVLFADDELLDAGDLPQDVGSAAGGGPRFVVPLGALTLEEIELRTLRAALEATGGNQVRAARLLGVSRDTLRYRMKKFGLFRASA